MASTNFKLFDENKQNMMPDQEYNTNQARLGGTNRTSKFIIAQ